MASATDLVSNLGNVSLSQGSNPDIGVVLTPESSGFNKMQEVANKMMLQDHAFNYNMFQQKVADRDALLSALDKGQVQSGKIDEVDRPEYDKVKKEQDDAFKYFADNGGVNNKEAYQKWIDKTTELKNIATHLQGREIGIAQQKADIAAEQVKAKKDERQAYLDRQLAKGSGAMIDPYQQSLEFDADKLRDGVLKNTTNGVATPSATSTQSIRTTSIAGKPDKVTVFKKATPLATKNKAGQLVTTNLPIVQGAAGSVNVPQGASDTVYKNGLPYNVTTQYVDFGRLKQNANDQYLDPKGEGTELQNQLYDKFTDPNYLSHPEVADTYKAMVKAAQDYNKARGFVADANGDMSVQDLKNGAADVKKLINGLNVPPDPRTGKRQILLTKPELAAYFTLAGLPNFASKSETLMKDEAKLSLEGEKIRGELKLKAADAASKAQLRNAQIKKLQKATAGKSEAEEAQEYNKQWDYNGVTILGSKDGVLSYKNSRPIYIQGSDGAPKILKPINGKPIYDNVDANGSPAKDAKIIGYEDGHYNTEFYNKSTGQVIPQATIQDAFAKQKAKDPKLTEAQALENMRTLKNITYRAVGSNNQVANIDDNGNNLRVLNNKYKKKDQQDPIIDDTQLFEQ